MPMVNGKEFAYSAKGMKAAKMEAKKTGKKMVVKKTIKNGKPANTIKAKNRAVDRKGNNLNELAMNALKALGWK